MAPIYWIVDFPDHEVSRLLLHAMVPEWYTRWAASACRECATMTANQEQDKVSAMNEGSRAAFSMLITKQEKSEKDITFLKKCEEERRRSDEEWKEECRSRYEANRRRDEEQHEQLFAILSGLTMMQQSFLPQPSPTKTGQRVAQLVHPQSRSGSAGAHDKSENDEEQKSPRLPAIPNKLPKTLKALLEEHHQYNLTLFDLAPKVTWSAALKLNFNKRQYLYQKIVEQAEQLAGDDKLIRAAAILDIKRGSHTASKFYESLRSNNPFKKTRKRKTPDQQSNHIGSFTIRKI
jgi:hypothetical protein